MRRSMVLAGLLALALLAAGCFQVEQFVDLSAPDEGVGMHLVLRVDKAFSGAELDLFIDGLHRTLPIILDESAFSRLEEMGAMGTWVVYEWIAHEKQPLDQLPFTLTQDPDGTYSFNWPLAPMEGFSEQTDSDDVLMIIGVALPAEVDFANTMQVEGNRVTWELRKAELAQGARLRAITLPE